MSSAPAGEAFFDRPRALRMVLTLAHHGAMTARDFGEAAEYVPEAAKLLREDLERWGLVTITPTVMNGKAAHSIELTMAGRRVAELARELEPLLEHGRAVRAIRALATRGPLTTRQFAEATMHVQDRAKGLREALEQAGVVTVEEVAVHSTRGHRIVLTTSGRRLADLCGEIARVVERAAKAT